MSKKKLMQAEVTRPFKGVVDGEVYPKSWKPGDVVAGNLAEAAVAAGHAKAIRGEKKAKGPTDNRDRGAAPENKSVVRDGGRAEGGVAVGPGAGGASFRP